MSEASQDTFSTLSQSLAQLVERVGGSVVAVHSCRTQSSGFVWRDGLVVTADEALAEEGEVFVASSGGERRRATIVGRDPTTDVALLRVEGVGAPVSLDHRTPAAGSLALVLGRYEGAPLSAFGGVALAGPQWRSMRGGRIEARLELDFGLRRQAEGGLAFDPQGHAFGMAVFGPRRRALVIPGATIERVAAVLERHGRIPHGYLGLGLQPVRVDRETRGIMVTSVDGQGPGAAADVRQGDVIVTWDGEPIKQLDTLLHSLTAESIGRAVKLGIRRGGAPLELTLTIGERAAG